MFRNFLVAALAALFLYTLAFAGNGPEIENRVQKYTLANGLRILVVERPISPTVSLYIRHRAGAIYESAGKTGTAHLLEHMLFKGTETIGTKDFAAESAILKKLSLVGNALDGERKKGNLADGSKIRDMEQQLSSLQKQADALTVKSEIDRIYTENGAVHSNAGTSQDLTSYYVSLPANKIELWARIEADRMIHPVFREFYSERKVVREERRQSVESNPSRMLLERFQSEAFRVHPYGRPVIGLSADIDSLSMDDVHAFFKTHYAPNHTVIAVVGAVSAPSVLSLIETYFGRIPPSVDRPVSPEPEPVQLTERRVQMTLDANPELLIGYHKPTLPSREDSAFDLIDGLLSGGRTSRFYKTLVVQKGIAQQVGAWSGFPGNLYPNLFVVQGKPRAPHAVGELEAGIDAEIEALKRNPVSAAELEKVKNQIKMDFLRDLSSNEGIAAKLSYAEAVAGDFRFVMHHLETIDTITPEEIMQTARKYLTQDNRTVAVLLKGAAQ